VLVAGCGAGRATAEVFEPGTSHHPLGERSYRLYVPAGLSGPAPLLVMLHGGFGSAAQAQRAYGWDGLADAAKVVIAYPDGVGRAWNTGGDCCGRPARNGVDDVGFIASVVADVGRNLPIDPARTYATGISNGGMMAYSLACQTELFAAIGPVAATQLDPCPAPRPTSVLHIHGTGDQMVRYDGSPGVGVARIDGPSVAELNAFWRNVDQCGAPIDDTSGVVRTSTAECADGRAVELITVDGGEHEWPAFATDALWRFFAAHPRP
jgi:polyhydroxybutyrate depolymerase